MESLCVRHINPPDLQYRMSRSLYYCKSEIHALFDIIFVFLVIFSPDPI